MTEPVVKLKLKRIKGWAVTREGEVAAVKPTREQAERYARRWAKSLRDIGITAEVVVERTRNGATKGS